MAWSDSSVEDAAEGDTAIGDPLGYEATAGEVAAAESDPLLQPAPEVGLVKNICRGTEFVCDVRQRHLAHR